MAKGNIFMGYGRGKVGSVVYAINKGQQVSRAYNPTKNNPRTMQQTSRRIRWTVASLFFKHAKQAQFKFAFENKKQTENDQNVYMMLNRGQGMYILKDEVGEENLPMLGNWIISKGSLKKLPYTFDDVGHVQIEITVPKVDIAQVTSISQLRQILIDYGYKLHDIVTITMIQSDAIAWETSNPILYDTDPDSPGIQWNNIQFVLSPNLNGNIATLGLTVTRPSSKHYIIKTVAAVDMDTINGCVVQVSRQTPRKLLVTTSSVVMNEQAQQAYTYATGAEWIQECYYTWGMGDPALLKGEAASTNNDGYPLEMEIDFVTPISITQAGGKHFTFNKVISRSDVAKRLAIWFEGGIVAQYRILSTDEVSVEVYVGNLIDLAFTLKQEITNPLKWTITNPTGGGFTISRVGLHASSW